MITVEVANRQAALEVDTDVVSRIVTSVLRGEGVARGEISVAIVGDAEIHDLNRRFLEHDYPTDVLSFLLDRSGDSLEGEVIISAERAIARGRDEGWTAHEELTLYLVHGTLHLLGYDDKLPEAEASMRRQEDYHLLRLGISRPDLAGQEQTLKNACAGSRQGDRK